MCTYSMIMDDWNKRMEVKYPGQQWTGPNDSASGTVVYNLVSNFEFNQFKEEMKKELDALKALLVAAKIYDTESGQPDCENAEKVALLKKLAELVGVDLKDAL